MAVVAVDGAHPAVLQEAFGEGASAWKSVRPGKIKWNEALVASVAQDIMRSIPNRALNIIRTGNFGGADLIRLESDIHRPSFREIAANYVWLRPVVAHFPTEVPGGLFLTDVFLYLDKMLGDTLLCKKDVAKVTQASEEANRVKRLMGALRYLYRNSYKSFNERVSELKSMLQPSPRSSAGRLRRLGHLGDESNEVLPMRMDPDDESDDMGRFDSDPGDLENGALEGADGKSTIREEE